MRDSYAYFISNVGISMCMSNSINYSERKPQKNYIIKLNLMLGCSGKFRRCDVRDKFLFRTDDSSSIIKSVKSEYSQRWILNASVTENRAVPISLYPILPERAARLRKNCQQSTLYQKSFIIRKIVAMALIATAK